MSSIKRDGDNIVMTLSKDDAFALRVALTPVKEGEVTSAKTKEFRDRLSKAIARASA